MTSEKLSCLLGLFDLKSFHGCVTLARWENGTYCLPSYHIFYFMIMMNCFCGMVNQRKAFSLTSSRDHCQRSSPLETSDTPRERFEYAQNLSPAFVEWSCTVVITTTPRPHEKDLRIYRFSDLQIFIKIEVLNTFEYFLNTNHIKHGQKQ